MGSDLYRSQAARAVFDQADHLLGFSLSKLCFEGPEDTLTATINQQPAIFTASVAAWQEIQAQNMDLPAYVAGHSLGEFSALAAAGSISFADGLMLVRRRGELMELAGEQSPGGMTAVLALETAVVEQICVRASVESGHVVQLANDNCPGQLVISGDKRALTLAEQLAKEAGARKVARLPITIAAHSELMRSAADEFAKIVDTAVISPPRIPIIGNVSAHPLKTTQDVRAEIKAQLTSPVAWTASIRYLLAQGVDTVVEVGPGKVLLGLMKRIDRKIERVKFEYDPDRQQAVM